MQHFAVRVGIKKVLAVSLAVVLAATLSVPSLAFADPTSADKQAEAQAALVSLNAMQQKLGETADNYDEALKAQQEAEANRDDAQVRIDEATGKIADLQDRLGLRARSMYRTGSSTIFDLLLGATTFQAFSANWDILNSMNQNDAELVQETKDLRTEVQEQEVVFAEQERVAKEKADEAKRLQDETAATIAAMQSTYDSLSAEASALLAQERAAQEAAAAARAQAVVDSSIEQAKNNDNSNTNGGDNNNGGGNTPAPAPNPPYNPGTGNAVVDRAASQIGKEYGYDDPSYGAGPSQYDCSGFVSYALTGSHSRLGSTYTYLSWSRVSDPQPGDVAVNEGHCGIYIGGNQMIHSSTYGVGVITGPVQGGMVIVRPPW